VRLPRPQIENCCVHVTHRCQERRRLLGTDIDRKLYVKRLWQASRRFRTLRVLDYVVTSNHVHLLVWVPRMADLSAMMKWLHGTVAGDCNRRVGREGAFWRGRFHATLVQSGIHLSRCVLYLDMNMVRAGVVAHPRQWRFGGYQEISGVRQRYRVIDQPRLQQLLDMPDVAAFRRWYEATLDDLCSQAEWSREPFWSRSLAVGSREWLRGLTDGDALADVHIRPSDDTADHEVWTLAPPQSLRASLHRRLKAG
jgi:putative transposase